MSDLLHSYLLANSESSGWWRALLKRRTTWWRWRSVVKCEGCPWYPWQRKTGQLVKFSAACQDGKAKKITIANWPPPFRPRLHKPQHPNGFLGKGGFYFLMPWPCLQLNELSPGNGRLGEWQGGRMESRPRGQGLFREKLTEFAKKKSPFFFFFNCHFLAFSIPVTEWSPGYPPGISTPQASKCVGLTLHF